MTIIKGTPGNDVDLIGTEATDFLIGDLGNDIIKGLAGDDRVFGGEDKDRLSGDNGNDHLYGGLGIDTLAGGAGDDSLLGDSGYQVYSQAETADLVNGGEGNDTVYTGINDIVLGGSGEDLIYLDIFNEPTTLYQINFANIDSSVAAPIAGGNTFLSRTRIGQVERVVAYFDDVLPGSAVFGSSGDDNIEMRIYDAGLDGKGVTLAGADGDDRLTGTGCGDFINGGAGNDQINGSNDDDDNEFDSDVLVGGSGSDIFSFFPNFYGFIVDIIRDFSAADDLIAVRVVRDGFEPTDFGSQTDLLLKTTTPSKATTPEGIAQFIYETDKGRLYIDHNGAASGGLELFLILSGRPNISANNFLVEYQEFPF